MGSIVENRYRYSIDTLAKVSLVSILRYPSKNPHYELYIHKLVMYFDFQTLNFLDISILDLFFAFLVTIPVTIPSIDT